MECLGWVLPFNKIFIFINTKQRVLIYRERKSWDAKQYKHPRKISKITKFPFKHCRTISGYFPLAARLFNHAMNKGLLHTGDIMTYYIMAHRKLQIFVVMSFLLMSLFFCLFCVRHTCGIKHALRRRSEFRRLSLV